MRHMERKTKKTGKQRKASMAAAWRYAGLPRKKSRKATVKKANDPITLTLPDTPKGLTVGLGLAFAFALSRYGPEGFAEIVSQALEKAIEVYREEQERVKGRRKRKAKKSKGARGK